MKQLHYPPMYSVIFKFGNFVYLNPESSRLGFVEIGSKQPTEPKLSGHMSIL